MLHLFLTHYFGVEGSQNNVWSLMPGAPIQHRTSDDLFVKNKSSVFSLRVGKSTSWVKPHWADMLRVHWFIAKGVYNQIGWVATTKWLAKTTSTVKTAKINVLHLVPLLPLHITQSMAKLMHQPVMWWITADCLHEKLKELEPFEQKTI